MSQNGLRGVVPDACERAQAWASHRTYVASPSLDALASRKRHNRSLVSVVIPALNEAETIEQICRSARSALMEDVRLVDELLVIDGGSSDGTREAARRGGATVLSAEEVLPQVPALSGKGEVLWRSLAAVSGDIVVWIDADIRNFRPHFVSRLVAPLLLSDEIKFVKAFYRRPIEHAGSMLPSGGGRVTELLARPLLNLLFPELGGVLQPLSGEYAGRRGALMRVPFFTGYGVEAGLLIDLLDTIGLDAMAQVDLEERIHRNRPLAELGPMAFAIAQVILKRAEERGRMAAAVDFLTHPLLLPDGRGVRPLLPAETERPPMTLLPSYLEALGASVPIAAAR